MNKFVLGVVCTLIGVVSIKEAYKLGYVQGVREHKRMRKFAEEIAKAVKEES